MAGRPYADKEFFRHNVQDPSLAPLHDRLARRVSRLVSRPLQRTYATLSLYAWKGRCPRHKDRPQVAYTLDLCVSQSRPWPLYVDGRPYVLEENDALVYCGIESYHYRRPLARGQYCNVALFHYVEADYQGPLPYIVPL